MGPLLSERGQLVEENRNKEILSGYFSSAYTNEEPNSINTTMMHDLCKGKFKRN